MGCQPGVSQRVQLTLAFDKNEPNNDMSTDFPLYQHVAQSIFKSTTAGKDDEKNRIIFEDFVANYID
ncbi:hypothetical protein PsorP6_007983 [Peronosclerospora sorghi]|uniref:Uncharacterized protein n=1 Tax=Peronosclerospora sorghi TaxID=230839 RepID=A0ACC0W8K9_9STRA|nr:hypothetical protein PsorP6_007983 [Peronosclerospora sorghi]